MISDKLKVAAFAVAGLLMLASTLVLGGVAAWIKIEAQNDAATAASTLQKVKDDAAKKQGLIDSLNAEIGGLNGQLRQAEKSAELETRLGEQSRKIRSISDAIAKDARSDPGLQGPVDPDLKRGLVDLDRRMRAYAASRTGDGDQGGDGQAGHAAGSAGKLPGAAAVRN